MVNSYFRYGSSTRVFDKILEKVLEQYKTLIRSSLILVRDGQTEEQTERQRYVVNCAMQPN